MKIPNSRIPPRRLTIYGALMGLGMILAAGLWGGVIQGHDLRAWFPLAHWREDLILGGMIGTGFALAAWRLLDVIPALKQIEQTLYVTLDMDALRFYHAAIYGLLAGIPEEILFRGALQPTAGLVIAALVFGILHAVSFAYFVYAALAGLMLGGLAIWREGLWSPIAAHTAIDAIMFVLLIRRWRQKS